MIGSSVARRQVGSPHWVCLWVFCALVASSNGGFRCSFILERRPLGRTVDSGHRMLPPKSLLPRPAEALQVLLFSKMLILWILLINLLLPARRRVLRLTRSVQLVWLPRAMVRVQGVGRRCSGPVLSLRRARAVKTGGRRHRVSPYGFVWACGFVTTKQHCATAENALRGITCRP